MSNRQWYGRTASELVRATGLQDPVEAIRSIARELVDTADLTQPPADLPMLASFRNINPQFQYCNMRSAGRLVPTEGGTLRIEVNAAHTPGKQNFTIAHEITHTLLPTYRRQCIEDVDTGRFWVRGNESVIENEDEALCDVGAAALLMDDRWLKEAIGDVSMTMMTLVSVAELFQVSLHAMAWQLSRLATEPLAFVIWQFDYRKDERAATRMLALPGFDTVRPKLRVKRVYPSASFPRRWFIPSNKSTPAESPVAQALDAPLSYTSGPYAFDFGSSTGIVRLNAENLSVPVANEARVISLLKPISSMLPSEQPVTDQERLALFQDWQVF